MELHLCGKKHVVGFLKALSWAQCSSTFSWPTGEVRRRTLQICSWMLGVLIITSIVLQEGGFVLSKFQLIPSNPVTRWIQWPSVQSTFCRGMVVQSSDTPAGRALQQPHMWPCHSQDPLRWVTGALAKLSTWDGAAVWCWDQNKTQRCHSCCLGRCSYCWLFRTLRIYLGLNCSTFCHQRGKLV